MRRMMTLKCVIMQPAALRRRQIFQDILIKATSFRLRLPLHHLPIYANCGIGRAAPTRSATDAHVHAQNLSVPWPLRRNTRCRFSFRRRRPASERTNLTDCISCVHWRRLNRRISFSCEKQTPPSPHIRPIRTCRDIPSKQSSMR